MNIPKKILVNMAFKPVGDLAYYPYPTELFERYLGATTAFTDDDAIAVVGPKIIVIGKKPTCIKDITKSPNTILLLLNEGASLEFWIEAIKADYSLLKYFPINDGGIEFIDELKKNHLLNFSIAWEYNQKFSKDIIKKLCELGCLDIHKVLKQDYDYETIKIIIPDLKTVMASDLPKWAEILTRQTVEDARSLLIILIERIRHLHGDGVNFSSIMDLVEKIAKKCKYIITDRSESTYELFYWIYHSAKLYQESDIIKLIDPSVTNHFICWINKHKDIVIDVDNIPLGHLDFETVANHMLRNNEAKINALKYISKKLE